MYRSCFSYYLLKDIWRLHLNYSKEYEHNKLLYSFIGDLLLQTFSLQLIRRHVDILPKLFVRIYITSTEILVFCKELWGRTAKICYSLDGLKQLI